MVQILLENTCSTLQSLRELDRTRAVWTLVASRDPCTRIFGNSVDSCIEPSGVAHRTVGVVFRFQTKLSCELEWQKIDFDKVELTDSNDSEFLLALDQSLDQLAMEHPVAAQVVNLRFFAGLSIEQTSEVMDVSTRTVNRHWLLGKAWLYSQLSEQQDA